jgi:hypothetical protein
MVDEAARNKCAVEESYFNMAGKTTIQWQSSSRYHSNVAFSRLSSLFGSWFLRHSALLQAGKGLVTMVRIMGFTKTQVSNQCPANCTCCLAVSLLMGGRSYKIPDSKAAVQAVERVPPARPHSLRVEELHDGGDVRIVQEERAQ